MDGFNSLDQYWLEEICELLNELGPARSPDTQGVDPGALHAIRALEEFRLHIYLLIYKSFAYDQELNAWKTQLNNFRQRVAEGYSSFAESYETADTGSSELESAIETARKHIKWFEREIEIVKGKISSLKHSFPDLRRYIASNERAVDLSFKIRQLMEDSKFEMLGDHWDTVFINTCEALRLRHERNRDFPLWDEFDNKSERVLKANSDIIYLEEHGVEITTRLLAHFRHIQDKFSQKFVGNICDRYEFRCRYFDDELANIFKFMRDNFKTSPVDRIQLDISSNDDRKLDIGIMEWLTEFPREDSKNGYLKGHQLGFYRKCLGNQENDLADAWMKFRFDQNLDREKVLNMFQATRRVLKMEPKRLEHRIELNGSHEGVSSDYRLPVLRTTPLRSRDKPWWVKSLKTSEGTSEVDHANLKTSGNTSINTDDSLNSQAPTVPPPESSKSVYSDEELSRLLQLEAYETNIEAAKFYRDSDKLYDHDMTSVPMCPVNLKLKNCLNIKWNDHNGEQRERPTNFVEGGMYHCRAFSYDALNDEWLGKDVFCQVLRQLNVAEDGVSRVPILGDSGLYNNMQSLFKVYKDRGDHSIDRYLADVRAQSIAAYYADRFRERTEDKFGSLQMLNVEVLLVFDSSKRQTIIEIMVHEVRFNLDNRRFNFAKFTNNWSSKNRKLKLDVLEAFSHFSYDESEGVLMVTDLQGSWSRWSPRHNSVHLLTDPAVHCQTERPSLFGRSNYGVAGMKAFFSSVHTECNEVCRFLNLKRPDWE